MQQLEQEKFGVKVQSHDTIYFLSGFSFQHAFHMVNMLLSNTFQHRLGLVNGTAFYNYIL
jgi:hypothetical protein